MRITTLTVFGLFCVVTTGLRAEAPKTANAPHTGQTLEYVDLTKLRESKLGAILKTKRLAYVFEEAKYDAKKMGLTPEDVTSITSVYPAKGTTKYKSFGVSKPANTKITTESFRLGSSASGNFPGIEISEVETNLFKSCVKHVPNSDVWIDFRNPKCVDIIEKCPQYPKGIATKGCFDFAFNKIGKGAIFLISTNLDEERKSAMNDSPPFLLPFKDLYQAKVATITLNIEKEEILVELNLETKDEQEAKRFSKSFQDGLAESERLILKESVVKNNESISNFVKAILTGIKKAEVKTSKNTLQITARYDATQLLPLLEKLELPQEERHTTPTMKAPLKAPVKPRPSGNK